MNEVLKAISNPVRLQMLQWLKDPERHFGEQAEPFTTGVNASQFERCGLSQSTTSSHLAILHNAGLITASRIGQWVYYKRDEVAISRFLDKLRSAL